MTSVAPCEIVSLQLKLDSFVKMRVAQGILAPRRVELYFAKKMGQRLREARKAQELSRSDLCIRVGGILPQSRIRKFEHGEKLFGIEDARILAEGLGNVSATYLLGLDEESLLLSEIRQKSTVVLLFLPTLAQIPLDELLEKAGFPGSQMVAAGHAIRALLALKRFGNARHRHGMSPRVFCDANGQLRKQEQNEEILRFVQFGKARTGHLPEELVFDSKRTT